MKKGLPVHYITLHYMTLHYITLHCIKLHKADQTSPVGPESSNNSLTHVGRLA